MSALLAAGGEKNLKEGYLLTVYVSSNVAPIAGFISHIWFM